MTWHHGRGITSCGQRHLPTADMHAGAQAVEMYAGDSCRNEAVDRASREGRRDCQQWICTPARALRLYPYPHRPAPAWRGPCAVLTPSAGLSPPSGASIRRTSALHSAGLSPPSGGPQPSIRASALHPAGRGLGRGRPEPSPRGP